jgi:glycine betaine/proline transport system permease protein
VIKKFIRKHMRILALVAIILGVALLAIVLRQFNINTGKVPLGKGVELLIDWVIINLSPVLEAIKLVFTKLFVAVETSFLWMPWPAWIILMGALGWWLASYKVGILIGCSLAIIQLVGLWAEAMSTMALVGVAVILTTVIAIPIGVWAARSDRVESFLSPILDAMQTIPGMVYLIPAVMILGVGKVPAIAATMIFAIPPAIRLTNLGLRNVSPEVKEAASAFGASLWQKLTKVEIPMAIKSIMTGINQATMMSVSMVVIAAFIGAGGLGYSVLFALDRVRIGSGFEAGLAILAIAIVLDRLTQSLAKPRNQVKGKVAEKTE